MNERIGVIMMNSSFKNKTIADHPDAGTCVSGNRSLENEVEVVAERLEPSEAPVLSLGQYAYAIVDKQFHAMIKQEQAVLADRDPEPLHQMRVSSRRLRTALQVFQAAIALPKAASERRITAIAKTLGGLRDLDVQLADLQTVYRPRLSPAEQAGLDGVIRQLRKQRRQVYAGVADTLGRSRYRHLKTAYTQWLADPELTAIAQLPLQTVLPDLLSPLVSHLLLHPGWLVSAADTSAPANHTLHDLRKACKHLRYQTEFFTQFYGEPFQAWVREIKQLQEKLGQLQDSHVLQALLAKTPRKRVALPTLDQEISTLQTEILADWERLRQPYLDPAFRTQLYRVLLEPLM